MDVHPELRRWVVENIKIGHDLGKLKIMLLDKGHDPSIVDKILEELGAAEQTDEVPQYIVDWLKYAEQQGESIETMRQKLLSHGMSEEQVRFLMQRHVVPNRQEHLEQFHTKKKKYHGVQWLALALIVLVAVGIAIFLFRGCRAVPAVTTTTLAGQTIYVNVMQPATATFHEKQAEGVKLATQSILGYNSTLPPGRYKGVIRAKADKAPVINAYISKNFSAGIRTPLLKQYKSDRTQDFFYIDTKADLDYGWPHLLIATNDQLLNILEVDSSSWKDFSFDFELQKPVGRIWVYFFDDWVTRGVNSTITAERNVYIREINFYAG